MFLVKKFYFVQFLFWSKNDLEILFGDPFDRKESS